MRNIPAPIAAIIALTLPAAVLAAEPVRHVAIYVQAYYEAAATPDAAPKVSVGASFDALLASTRPEDILAARDNILADPKLVTPMTMMVLAIRLYDFGMRDDALLWFYIAKDRFVTLAHVIDIHASNLGPIEDAMRGFVTLAGSYLNGYAFCDIANQQAIRARALAWVEANPYGVLMLTRLKARTGDRGGSLIRSINRIKADAGRETAFLADPNNRADFLAARSKNEMDEKFCWK